MYNPLLSAKRAACFLRSKAAQVECGGHGVCLAGLATWGPAGEASRSRSRAGVRPATLCVCSSLQGPLFDPFPSQQRTFGLFKTKLATHREDGQGACS